MKRLYQFLCLSFFLLFLNVAFAQDAVYKIEFISNWSSTTHPTDYPTGSAHWSPLIGMTHTDAVTFLQLGAVASDGVEQVAETGGTTTITQEINALITANIAFELINGSGLGTGPGTITINSVNVDVDFPYLSLITMIAPSPDWVAQINNLKLTDNNNNWLTSISVDVHATDAGTDSGTTYTSANADTNPAQNISSLENMFPFSSQKIGTFVVTLEQVLSIENNTLENDVSIYPNPNNGTFFIKNSGTSIIERVDVYSINGKKLKSFNMFTNQKIVAFNSLKSGLYFLKIYADNSTLIKKFIIE